ncbi:MAG: glycosyltransferase [Candidatus Omnitrophica bacterium]|nr:glycosyltransferase [Candidatus Omnitrophota bacterium]MDD5081189.1 glycosyltransferase [Candidatus Omnitrophota bacterium]MDD5440627.1 glycosyltransferase [Candidatus Omnitrophota bacterium]
MKTEITIDSYRDIAPKGTIDLIYNLVNRLKGRSLLHVNSTKLGGGVAEMLLRLVPLFNNLGIQTRWEIIQGTPLFYQTTKSFHNALQGQPQIITDEMFNEYKKVNQKNARNISFDSDVAIIHDPQPAAFIYKKPKKAKWLWRCHIDVSRPNRKVWNFLREYVARYDGAIFSLPSFAQKLAIPQFLVYPSIDPLSDKNKELPRAQINSVLDKYAIPRDKPIILQVSRFDRFKDPLGVIKAYELVKKHNECCLVLAGGGATDDPEGLQVLNEVKEAAGNDKDIFVLDLPPDANLEINAFQRAATIILQKSVKEGFGLTVAEGMWKGKPVIGGAVGGINVQIVYGRTGYTVNSIEGCAYRIRYLLNNPLALNELGENAKEYIRRNFLITRHLCDYLALMIKMLNI